METSYKYLQNLFQMGFSLSVYNPLMSLRACLSLKMVSNAHVHPLTVTL